MTHHRRNPDPHFQGFRLAVLVVFVSMVWLHGLYTGKESQRQVAAVVEEKE